MRSICQYNPPHVRLAVLASHEGTTLQGILDACRAGTIPCRATVDVSNNQESRALERARAAAVPAHHLSSQTHPDLGRLDAAICQVLVGAGAELVLLAGFMKESVLGRSRVSKAAFSTPIPRCCPSSADRGCMVSTFSGRCWRRPRR
ncbi:MAG: formyltransferase family protein [Candidatus Rokuibacteriota bacterium]